MEAAPAAPEPTEKRPAPFSPEVLARELNPAQLEAVLRPPGPMVVVAGAGSGKTRVITYRLARLVATGADPRRIVAVTFTNKAAGELRERVDKLLWERMKVGSRTFFTILRTWARERRYGAGTTPQLECLAERLSGQKLDHLFHAWLYVPHKPLCY